MGVSCFIKSKESIDRIIQVNNINIGNNLAKRRKALQIKQIDMVAKLQISGIDISIYSYNKIEKAHKIQLCRFCMPAVTFLIVT